MLLLNASTLSENDEYIHELPTRAPCVPAPPARYGFRDHEAFIDDEFFKTLVLHQIQAAIDELAASA